MQDWFSFPVGLSSTTGVDYLMAYSHFASMSIRHHDRDGYGSGDAATLEKRHASYTLCYLQRFRQASQATGRMTQVVAMTLVSRMLPLLSHDN